MARRESGRRSSRGSRKYSQTDKSSSSGSYGSGGSGSGGGGGGGGRREEVVKEAVANVIVNERSKYETKIRASQTRLTKYTAENDRLLDEVSNLRLQIGEMKNDRSELVRAHHESMSLLAQVSEEKLVEFKSKSEQEAVESKAAQEEALRTVLEMMEKDCEDRVAELDSELARIEEDRERATQLQIEAAARAEEEGKNCEEMEETAKLAVEKLVEERVTRDMELQNLEEREAQLKRELEMTKQQAEMDKRDAQAAHAAAQAAQAVGLAAAMNSDNNQPPPPSNSSNAFGPDSVSRSSGDSDPNSYDSNSSTHSEPYSEPYSVHGDEGISLIREQQQRAMQGGPESVGSGGSLPQAEEEPKWNRPPVVNRGPMQRASESPFLNDPLHGMTRGRKIALKLQNLPWYQPKGSKHWDSEGIGLQSAWAHFEHSVLPRYLIKNPDGSMPEREDNDGRDDQRPGSDNSRIDVYESDAGSTDAGDTNDFRSDAGESDVDDWLDPPQKSKKNNKPKRPKGKKSSGARSQKGNLSRAEPGESKMPTRLYSPLFTPLSQLGDFGIGVGLYFSSLRAVAFITLIAGCINLPNILYFAGDEYSKSQPGVNYLLKGSAICTEQVWVPCPTCTLEQFEQARSRIAGATTVTPNGELQTLVFALKNACDGATFQVGIVNMASLGFILLSIALLSLYQRKKQIAFDEQEQTAQDYSIEISNPPNDATEPEEWKEFFESRFGGHLTCCTVTIDNDLLIKALARRREVLFDIEEKLKEGASIDTLTLTELAAKIEHGRESLGRFKSRLSPGIPELVGQLTVLNARIQGLAQQEYRATRVFCTFETEGAQRQVLAQMTVGSMVANRNNTHKINSNLLFRGEHVLLVREAEEPNTIRWLDLDEKWSTKVKQMTVTTLMSLGFTAGVAAIVWQCKRHGSAYAALAISLSNASFPIIAKAVTDMEAHASESTKQASLYAKIAIFRWVVTAIVITIITPFTSTISNGPEHLLQSIYLIFFADLITTNVLQLTDPVSNFKRHFLAPRAGSQERMNLLMGGTDYTIAERYTNMTKTLFLTFYYCAIYPSAFFMCAVTLFVNFYVDKFSLMRTWKPAPMLGPYIAKFSRTYFMTTAIVALAVISSYLFSGFPFDNLCAENVSHSAYYGHWKITDGEGLDKETMIEPTVRSYHFCNQFLGPGSTFKFPALPDAQPEGSNWMTDEQEQLTGIYGWVSVGVLGLVGLIFLYRAVKMIKSLFSASYKPDGDVQGESFSQVETISSYIPQVDSNHFTHPLLAVNIDYVDESIFDWSDPERSHSYYDLTRDAEQLMKGNEDICQRAFAQIRHWPLGGGTGGGGIDVVEEGGEKVSIRSARSALRTKSRDISSTNKQQNNVSWSSKVTCKTYSKDNPNLQNFGFNANASTTEGMNFNGHSDPLYDPHAQNEARVAEENLSNGGDVPVNNFDPYAPNTGNAGNNFDPYDPNSGQQEQQNQPPPDQHFDQYFGAGLDYANQPQDAMYGDSQVQDSGVYVDPQSQGNAYVDPDAYVDPQSNQDGASWEGSDGSYEQKSGSGSSGTSGSYSHSGSSGTDSYNSDASSQRADSPSSLNQQQPQNQNDDGSGSTYGGGSAGSSRDGSTNSSASAYSEPPRENDIYETEVYEDDQEWEQGEGQETGSYSTGSSASGGLPPIA